MVKVKDRVRVYDRDWFDEGVVLSVDGGLVKVDFNDWIQLYLVDNLVERCTLFSVYWVPNAVGSRLVTF